MDWKELQWLIATGQADVKDFAGLEFARVLEAKVSADMVVRANACDIVERAEAPAESRKIAYIASTEDVDRMGDIIRVYGAKAAKGEGGGKGWLLDNHKANPVGLWCHESWMPPIANVEAWREKAIVQKGVSKPALMSVFDYHSADENPAAEIAFKLARKKALRAVSVGFKPTKWISYDSPEDRQAAGLGPWGVEFIEQDLHEVSNCAVPANPFALQTGLKSLVASGEVTERDAAVFARIYPLTEAELVSKLRDKVRSFVDMGARKTAPAAPAPAPAAPAEKATCITIKLTGCDAVKSAVDFLLSAAGSAAFRGAVEAAAAERAAAGVLSDAYSLQLAWQPTPDPEPAPERSVEDDAAALAEAMPKAARAAVSKALGAAFEQLAAAQDVLSVVIDAVECDAVEDADVAAMTSASNGAPSKAEFAELVRSVTDLVKRISGGGGGGGAKAPQTAPQTDAAKAFDPTAAAKLVADLKTLAGAGAPN